MKPHVRKLKRGNIWGVYMLPSSRLPIATGNTPQEAWNSWVEGGHGIKHEWYLP